MISISTTTGTRKFHLYGLLLLAALLILPGAALAQTKQRVSIATGGTGGVYYPYGGAIAAIISKHVPGVEATAEVTAAAVDNLKLVGAGKADFGFAYPDLSLDANQGKGVFRSKMEIRMVAHLYVSYLHLVTLDGAKIKGVKDLKGKRVSTGAPGSGTEIVCLRVIEAAGLSPDKDMKRDRLSVNESAGALKDGKVDAFFWVGGLPTAAILDLAATPGVTMHLVAHDETLPKIFEKHGQVYVKANIPKATYPSLPGDVGVVGIPNVLVCSAKAKDDLIYQTLKVMFDRRDDLIAVHKEARNLTLEGAVLKGSAVPYHPGAAKYFQEKGQGL